MISKVLEEVSIPRSPAPLSAAVRGISIQQSLMLLAHIVRTIDFPHVVRMKIMQLQRARRIEAAERKIVDQNSRILRLVSLNIPVHRERFERDGFAFREYRQTEVFFAFGGRQ